MPVTPWSAEPPFSTGPASARTPTENRNASANTTVEWPREKKKPTLSGRLPSAMNLRVVLSIAAMWSASNAWRRPSVYAVMPMPSPNTPCEPRLKCRGTTSMSRIPNPITCSPITAAASHAARRRSSGASRFTALHAGRPRIRIRSLLREQLDLGDLEALPLGGHLREPHEVELELLALEIELDLL